MNYDINYFISKFSAIPEELWCVAALRNDDKRCAQGHCMDGISPNGLFPKEYKDERFVEGTEVYCLLKIFKKHFGNTRNIVHINNGYEANYQQPTPKQRILAALRDIKEMQEPEKSETTIEKLLEEKVFA